MNNVELKNSGFIPSPHDPKAYVFGDQKAPFVVRVPDGDWRPDLPIKEYQSRPGLETYNCTGFNTLSKIEAYLYRVFGETVNYSDRWLGIVAGTSHQKGGNDPQTVYEAIRAYGLIPEEMLPFSDDIGSTEEYYSFKGADEAACRAEGKKWLEKYDFYHDWVVADGMTKEEAIQSMKLALTSSPLCIGVYAWATNEKGIYVKLMDENHWTCMAAYDDLERIFDSYDPVLKDANQEIFFCKRIHIDKKVPLAIPPSDSNPIPRKPLFVRFMEWITNLIKKHAWK